MSPWVASFYLFILILGVSQSSNIDASEDELTEIFDDATSGLREILQGTSTDSEDEEIDQTEAIKKFISVAYGVKCQTRDYIQENELPDGLVDLLNKTIYYSKKIINLGRSLLDEEDVSDPLSELFSNGVNYCTNIINQARSYIQENDVTGDENDYINNLIDGLTDVKSVGLKYLNKTYNQNQCVEAD